MVTTLYFSYRLDTINFRHLPVYKHQIKRRIGISLLQYFNSR